MEQGGRNLVISFQDEDIESLCCNQRVADRKLGKLAQKLRARIADLDAAQTVGELVAGRPHPLNYDREGQYAVNLDKMHRLVFEPDGDVPLLESGAIDWKLVSAVRIVFIGDYHD